MKKFILYIVAKFVLWRCPFKEKRMRKAKTTKSYYIEYKYYFGHRGGYCWQKWARVSDHLPTKGKGKIKKHTKYKSIIIKGFTK